MILSLAGDIIPFIYKVTDSSAFDKHKLCLPHNIETTIDGCHLNKVLSKQEVTKKRFMNSVSALNIPNMGPAIAADDAGTLWVATRRTDTNVDIPTETFG